MPIDLLANKQPRDLMNKGPRDLLATSKPKDLIGNKPERESLWGGFVWPTIKDTGKVAGTAAGMGAAFIGSGIAGSLRALPAAYQAVTGDMEGAEKTMEGAAKTIEEIQSAPANLFTPAESAGGKTAMGAIEYPFEKIAVAKQFYWDKTVELTGSEEAGAAVATAFEVAVYLGLPFLKKKLSSQIKARKIVEARETVKEIHRERLRILEEEPEHLGELARKEAALKKPVDLIKEPAESSPIKAAADAGVEYKGSQDGIHMFQDKQTGSVSVENLADLPEMVAKKRAQFAGEKEVPISEGEGSWKDTLYRGTAKETTRGEGSYTPNKEHAKGYGKNIHEVKLELNSKVFEAAKPDKDFGFEVDVDLLKRHDIPYNTADPAYAFFTPEVKAKLKAKGYDAITFPDEGVAKNNLEVFVLNKKKLIRKPAKEAPVKQKKTEVFDNIASEADSIARGIGDIKKHMMDPLSVESIRKITDRVSDMNPASWAEYLKNKKPTKEKNGVKLYSDSNEHYVVKGNNVHIALGFKGENVFKELAKSQKKGSTGGTTLSMLGTQGMYESLVKHAPKAKEVGKKAVEKFMDTVDVENRFVRVKAPETGFHVKNLFSKASRWEEWTIEKIKEVGKASKFDADIIRKAPLVTESAKSLKNADPIMKQVGKIYLDFSEKLKSEYKKRNVNIDYKQRILSEIQERMDITTDQTKLAELSKIYEKAKDLNFVHIPSALWFENKIGTPEGARSVMKLLAAKQRKTFNIKSLIDQGKLDPKDINLADIMASQGRRAGRDFALLDMVHAAKQEGLAFLRSRTDIPAEFVSLPETKVPILKGYKVHPLLADYLNREILGRGLDLGSVQKYMSMAKMAAFINPAVLPTYDLVQHAQLAAINGPLRSLPALARGIRKYATRDPEYYKALDNGLSSQPYNNPFNSYMDAAKWAQKRKISQVGLKAAESILPHKAVKHIYNASWYLAWEMDKMIRMGSYELLRKKGFNSRDAAQIAAKFHSDYASVPPKIRRVLNVPFFTPTFKITMGKLYLRMLADAAKSTKAMAGFKLPTGKQAVFAKAALGTLAINEAYDLFMTQFMGWKRDEWGRRYIKDVDTEEGTKQLTMTFSAPSNMWHKYYFRWKHAHSPEVEKPLYRFLEQNKWEIQPVFRVLWNIVENKDEQGNPIVSQFDDDSVIATKRLRYSIRSIVGLVGLVDRGKVDDEGRRKFVDEYGKIAEAAIRPFTFIYTRSPQNRKIMYQLRAIENNFMRDLKKTILRGEKVPEERYKNYEKKLNQIIKTIEE